MGDGNGTGKHAGDVRCSGTGTEDLERQSEALRYRDVRGIRDGADTTEDTSKYHENKQLTCQSCETAYKRPS